MRALPLALRPKTLSSLVGQEDLVKKIRGHMKRLPTGWMFTGESGGGKTTVARIIAVAVQCKHADVFGDPCKKCQSHYKKGNFDIYELNAGDVTGIDGLRDFLSGSDLVPRPGSRRRVYILDEVHGLSKNAQTLLYKYLEDCPPSTMWILCTTDADKVNPALRRRCTASYQMEPLEREGVYALVKRALKKVSSERDPDALSEALNEYQITSPGLVVKAVEKYEAGAEAEDAAQELVSKVKVYNICRALTTGNWEKVAKELRNAKPEDAGAIQTRVSLYLRSILVDEGKRSERATAVANAIMDLTSVTVREGSLHLSGVIAALFRVSKYFAGYKLKERK